MMLHKDENHVASQSVHILAQVIHIHSTASLSAIHSVPHSQRTGFFPQSTLTLRPACYLCLLDPCAAARTSIAWMIGWINLADFGVVALRSKWRAIGHLKNEQSYVSSSPPHR